MIDITVNKKGMINLRKVSKKLIPVVFDEMEDTGIRIRNHMIRAMDRTPRSGKLYRAGGKVDRRSLPGKAPAPDTSRLKNSLKVNVRKTALEVEVGSNLKPQGGAKKAYSEYLEEGTTHMKARPFLEPAIASATKNMGRRIERAIKRIK